MGRSVVLSYGSGGAEQALWDRYEAWSREWSGREKELMRAPDGHPQGMRKNGQRWNELKREHALPLVAFCSVRAYDLR